MLALVIPYPDIDPVIFQIGPFALRWYSLAYIGGLILGWRYLLHLLKDPKLWPTTTRGKEKVLKTPATALDIDDLLLWATLGVVIGGRMGYILFYKPQMLWTDPLAIFAVWEGGMSFHGGFLGVLIATALFCIRRNLNPLEVGDLVAAVAPIGLFFGRIANFINGELWGHVTNVPWAMVFPNAGPLPRHPSQIYEAALEGVALFFVLRIAIYAYNSLQRPGLTLGLFAIGYGLSRIFVEFFRFPDIDTGYVIGFITMGMVLSLPMVLVGLALIWRTMDNAPAWLKPGPSRK